MVLQAVENLDDDLDLDGPLLAHSISTHQTSISSRLSVRAESLATDEDWEVELAPNDEVSTNDAILCAKEAGIPIPSNVPSSALLGGTIKRLGNKKSRPNFKDEWGDDLDFTDEASGGLKLKMTPRETSAAFDEEDGFSDWAEGSLGIRTAGKREVLKNRNSSISALSPSMGSCFTAESEEDGLDGLDIPMTGPMTLALKKQPYLVQQEVLSDDLQPAMPDKNTIRFKGIHDDFFADMDLSADDVFDLKKKTLNRNIKPSWKPIRDTTHAPKAQASLTFTEKAATKIPRPINAVKPSRLEPVAESTPSSINRTRQSEPTTTSAQLLKSKRSVTALRNQQHPPSKQQAPHPVTQPSISRFAHYNNARRESDPSRAQSPPLRPHSRLSHAFTPDTPTRQRRDLAPPTLAREAATKRTLTRPARRRNFGDGTELDTFDDLPTSAAKESKFTKQPVMRQAQKTVRPQPSLTKLVPLREKMTTPLPPSTPRSTTKFDNLPRFARDTASSRIAREQKLGPAKNHRDGPLAPRTNWAAQVAARTPVTSPSANRVRRGPQLVNPMGKENIRHFQEDAAKKGMHWNPTLCRWEGNESALIGFDAIAPPSPPRPALITNISGTAGVQVVGGMVFDPQRMCWLKMGQSGAADPRSPSVDDDEDPFKDIEDLQDNKPQFERGVSLGGRGGAAESDWVVSEEFDLGPEFIRRQKEEEAIWRARTSSWFAEDRGADSEAFKWAIRDIAATAGL